MLCGTVGSTKSQHTSRNGYPPTTNTYSLGPATFIKSCEALSTRPDLIRKDFLEELIKLQDQLPPFSTPCALSRLLKRNSIAKLAKPTAKSPPNLSPRQVSVKSTETRLLTGEAVAVKVQRPNLLPVLSLDLYLMRWAAGWLGPLLPLNLGHDLCLIVDEFGIKLFEEIDYINEAYGTPRNLLQILPTTRQ